MNDRDRAKLIERVLPGEEARLCAGVPAARHEYKRAKARMFVERAIDRGLTMAMVEDNLAHGRPAIFVEYQEPELVRQGHERAVVARERKE